MWQHLILISSPCLACPILLGLAPAVVEAFGASGLLLPQDDRAVKLHATVINTRYRRRASGAGQQQGQRQGQLAAEQRQPFDGRQLLQSFGELDLGTVQLPAVHLSQRGRYDTKTGFYQALDSLPLL